MRRKTDELVKRIAPPGLRRRLIIALAVPLVLILCVSSILDYRLARKTSDSAHDQALADAVFDLESHIRSHPGADRLDLAGESEAMLRSNFPDQIFFSIRNSDGDVLAGDADVLSGIRPEDDDLAFSDDNYHEMDVRVVAHRVEISGAEMVITVLETTKKRGQSRKNILAAMLVPNLAVILAALMVVLIGVRRGLLPLDAVEKEIAERSPNDLREIDLATAPRDIHPMLRRLNELFVLLREASEAQKRFLADAAHQLRTPLAGLQTQIDLAVGEGAFSHNEIRLQNIEEGTARLARLLAQLLSYARAETSLSITEKFEVVALDQIVENAASTFLDAALQKKIDLGFEVNPARVNGISWLLQEALANLIDNAIRYTPFEGCITVRSGEDNKAPFIEVEDNGPGIPVQCRENVFQRFYRIPGSASNGCGLGLPIVKEIAELHAAEIVFREAGGNGLCIRLQFSAASMAAENK